MSRQTGTPKSSELRASRRAGFPTHTPPGVWMLVVTTAPIPMTLSWAMARRSPMLLLAPMKQRSPMLVNPLTTAPDAMKQSLPMTQR